MSRDTAREDADGTQVGQYSARYTQIYTHTRGLASIPNRDYLTLFLHLYTTGTQCTSSVGYLRHFIIFWKIFFLHFYCNIKCLSVILSVQSCKYRLTRHVCMYMVFRLEADIFWSCKLGKIKILKLL